MMLRVGSLVLAMAAGAAVAEEGDPIYDFANDDRTMNKAIAEAQATLPLFLCQALDEEGNGSPGGLVKVSVPVKHPTMKSEIIWVGPFAALGDATYAGLLSNQPHAIAGLNRGDQIDFTHDMIVDWMWYHPNGAVYGSFTTRVIYAQEGMTEDLAQLSTPAVDPGWTCETTGS